MFTQVTSYSHNLDEAVANRRGAFRHNLAAPVRVGSCTGIVRNLSTRGLYFVGSSPVRVGVLLELEIALPHTSPSGSITCWIGARVLRVEDLGGSLGIAAEIERWRMPEVESED
jgi:hypothetical protein